jgi:hypothetical protein
MWYSGGELVFAKKYQVLMAILYPNIEPEAGV